MNHFYESIPGWFDFENLYHDMIQKFPNGSTVALYHSDSLDQFVAVPLQSPSTSSPVASFDR